MTDTVKPLFDLRGKKIYVSGHSGMAGSALMRRLAIEDCELLTVDHQTVDLTHQGETEAWMMRERPDAVFLAAGRVGGIHANNTFPASFIADNIAIALNVMRAAVAAKVQKLLFLGSSCIFPRNAPQPMTEQMLLTGPLEPTNEWYAVAKIAGIKLAEAYRRQYGVDFISVMPTNLYGPGDNYHPENSHVPAALIRRFHEAKMKNAPEVEVWGTGNPKREFLAVDDLADACIFVMKHYSEDLFINVGTGADVSIREFAEAVADVVGYNGKMTFDTRRPDGAPRKLLDVSRLSALGWKAKTHLRDGLNMAYGDFVAHENALRER
ncbi:GDP-L-fucose synthase [Undibacter mobilis]|uniref:GDP-L-fucose synthase n=1 Tax=Undibacter mobilis TaxID=2292256 RepID=A0A371B6B5_9BRAD|nr:GDP-L-fucose synthase [Undibacter mobilis]RDV03129.1 GDP-L-fucose synthase [Undibacter mobilis]